MHGAVHLMSGAVSRRALLQGMAASAVVWTATFTTTEALASGANPIGLPPGVTAHRQAFENWSKEIYVEQVWTCSPRSSAELAALADWARTAGWTLRPRGCAHNWSPIVLDPGETSRVLLVDLRSSFTGYRLERTGSGATVTVGAGLSMDELMQRLEVDGLGFIATPAPPGVTVGGVLAIGGHGTGLSTSGRPRAPGETFSSLSNLIVALRAVVWDPARQAYAERRFQRDDPAIGPLLVGLGRVPITEVTLRVAANRNLRCVSRMDLSPQTLFAPPGKAGPSSYAALTESAGACEVIWFPFTPTAWTKTWEVAPTRPATSRATTTSGNYTFSDDLPRPLVATLELVTRGAALLTPTLMNLQLAAVVTGLKVTGTADLWGPSRHLLHYVRPDTLRMTANGYAVLCRRRDLQLVTSLIYQRLLLQLDTCRRKGQFPMNGPLELRVCELDEPADSGVRGAVEASFATLRRDAARPHFDVAVYIDLLTVPGTRGAGAFYRDFELWARRTFSGAVGLLRPEWSKGWGYAETGQPWADPGLFEELPGRWDAPGQDQRFRIGAWYLQVLDPHRVFETDLHRKVFASAT